MTSITLKKIPERLHHSFKARARLNRRSLQAEILHTLEESLGNGAQVEGIDVSSVAGILKPKRRGVSVETMKIELDNDFKKQWSQ